MDQEQGTAPVASAPVSSKSSSGGGAGKIILVIIILIIVLGGGYVAYAKFVKKASSVGEILNPSSLKLNPSCKYNDPDLCKFMNNWKEVKDLTMTSNGTDKDGVKSKNILKTKGDDKTQMIVEQDGKENYNYISIGNTTYTKDYTDNKWFKSTSSTNDITETAESQIDFDSKAESVEDKTTYKKIGTEACGKQTCFKYQVIDPAMTEWIQYIYFDNKEYILRKSRTEGKDGSIDESTFEYSGVSISEPSPVKEGSPYDVPASAISGTSDAAALEKAAEEALKQLNTATPAPTSSEALPTESTESTDPAAIDFPTEE